MVVMVWVSDTQSLSIGIKSDQIELARSSIEYNITIVCHGGYLPSTTWLLKSGERKLKQEGEFSVSPSPFMQCLKCKKKTSTWYIL